MSFNWSSYLLLAQELGGRADEAARRSAISRAYYCAFHVANDHLKANSVTLDLKRHSHERVWHVYLKSSKPECVKIGTDGNRLRVTRTDADYRLGRQVTSGLVQRSIQEAETIVAAVPVYLPESFIPKPTNRFRDFVRFIKKLFSS
jgi:uncharacterized protein (UPF0332 family)